MIVIGLTGSIGMGKSTTANMLRQMGIPVHDSDEAVHELLAAGGKGVAPVAEAFPGAVEKGAINRWKLREALGKDHVQWGLLESILHPLVQESQQAFIREQNSKGVSIVALDIPLLFETGAEKRVDYTICCTAPDFIQRQRVMARPGMTEEDFAFRLARQMPDAEKCRRADFLVHTGAGIEPARTELAAAIRAIRGRGAQPKCQL